MKKSVRILAIALVAVTLCLCFTSCLGTIKGEYTAYVAKTGKKFAFDGKKVTISYVLLGTSVVDIEATYKIKGDTISFDFAEEEDLDNEYLKDFVKALEEPVDFEKGDDYIKINGVKYEKAE